MKTEDYWEDAALQRELWLQENANKDLVNMLELYDKALTDIEKEIGRIKLNYQRRFGIDAETAQTYLDRQAQEQNLQRLLRQLEECETETERSKVLDFIHRDGLSTRAYSARIQRFEQLKSRIYIRMNELYKTQNAAMTETVKRVYRLAYYQTIDDTARGLNAGVSFDMLPDRAIEEVIKAPWSGRRFSASVWNNTTKLAQEAQEITARYLVTGRSLDKAVQEIAERFDVAKFRATTLVHTETSHARAAAEARVYEDLEVEEYQYLATLDHMTCERCGELDGMTFRIDEIREGVNYPVIHPRCRCTTTIAGSWGRERLARNPITGKNEKIDSSVTYSEWIKNMSEEERAAFKSAQRTYKNSAADKAQYERYKNVLGKDAPKSLDKFRAVKYNNSEAWETLKKLYAGVRDGTVIKNAGGEYITIVKRVSLQETPNSILQTIGKKGGINRNYYGADGWQVKQISNNDHGHTSESSFGKNGEHAHDYSMQDGNLKRMAARELNEEERKANEDIL